MFKVYSVYLKSKFATRIRPSNKQVLINLYNDLRGSYSLREGKYLTDEVHPYVRVL